MRLRTALVSVGLLTCGALSFASPPESSLKVYISVDMEGVAGVVTGEQLGPKGFEYARFRELMTREAVAAVEAAREAGAGEVLVSDSHGNGQNLVLEMFPPDVRVVRSWPRRLAMMAGIDESFDAVVFIGYHASTDNPRGVRAHTFSSARLTHLAVNGTAFTEGAWNAAIAGHFGVPVVMVSGDDAAIAEVREVVGDVEGAEVKQSLGFHSASTLTPEAARASIAEAVKSALGRLSEFEPFRVEGPVTVDVGFKHYRQPEVLAYLPLFDRTSSHSVRFRVEDMLEASDVRVFLLSYSSSLEP
jgi:D-amino peptidase